MADEITPNRHGTEAERAAWYDTHRAEVESWFEEPPPAPLERPEYVLLSWTVHRNVRAAVRIDPDLPYEEAVRAAYQRGVSLPLVPTAASRDALRSDGVLFAIEPAWRKLRLHPAVRHHGIEEPWSDDATPLGLGDVMRCVELFDRVDPDSALRSAGYLDYPSCAVLDGEVCGAQCDHDWKGGAVHTCSEIPGHRMDHRCTCDHEWRECPR